MGHSEGIKGRLENHNVTRDDQFTLTELYNDKFDGKDVPKFLVGHSMGGFISTNMVAERPD